MEKLLEELHGHKPQDLYNIVPPSPFYVPSIRILAVGGNLAVVAKNHTISCWGKSSFLWLFKDDKWLKMPEVHGIPCGCGQVCIGQTGCWINTRIKEHHQHVCLVHLDKLGLVGHSIDLEHCIQLQIISSIFIKSRYMGCIIRSNWDLGPSQQRDRRKASA